MKLHAAGFETRFFYCELKRDMLKKDGRVGLE